MRVYKCDIWSLQDRADAICITTNGIVGEHGRAVMGKGIALEAKQRLPGIDLTLGLCLLAFGNQVSVISNSPRIVAFPTKNNWKDPSDLELIKRSAIQLAELIQSHGWTKVAIPKPGCNNGGLKWSDVEPILDQYLPNVFVCDING